MVETAHRQALSASELVLGLTYGAGTNVDLFLRALKQALQEYDYRQEHLHLSNYFPRVDCKLPFNKEQPDAARDLMNMGDSIRGKLSDSAVIADLAMYLMAAARQTLSETTDRRVAWVIQSLKRPEEVARLREVYGPRFVLIGLHVPEPIRKRHAARQRQRWANVTSASFDSETTEDLRRDEKDRAVPHGQAFRDTFTEADFFLDARSSASIRTQTARMVHLMFGEPFVPPTREEQAMYHAYTAGLRSSEMGRQVGAALFGPTGEILAVGTNDVPAPGGGLYWSPSPSEPGDAEDGRDFAQIPPLDSNTLWQRRIARELLVQMRRTKWLNPHRAQTLPPDPTDPTNDQYDITDDQLDRFLRDVDATRFRALTEFGRSVHAEMDVITTAARNGIPVSDREVACTTFPCHNCTRHLIASGIRRVIYIYPYPKSLAVDLHLDAVSVDPTEKNVSGRLVFEHFVGVAPRVYPQYFRFPLDRKDPRGKALAFEERSTVLPRVLEPLGPFTFGGPVFPSTRVFELENQRVTSFERRVTEHSELELPKLQEA